MGCELGGAGGGRMTTKARVMSNAADLIALQAPVVAAARRWVAADAAANAARAAYDAANDAPHSPERSPLMSEAVAAMRAAWDERSAAARELAQAVHAFNGAMP